MTNVDAAPTELEFFLIITINMAFLSELDKAGAKHDHRLPFVSAG